MSTTLNIIDYFDAVIDAAVIPGGKRDVPVEVTVDGQKYDVSAQVVNTSGDNFNSKTLWEAGDGGLDDFDFLWLLSDADVLLELRNDAGTPEFMVVQVKANSPYKLRSTEFLANTTGMGADGSATTLATCDQIKVKNNATGAVATTTANVRLILVT